jgi:uncharacterized protein
MDMEEVAERISRVLRDAGARFAYVFGSRAGEGASPDSDLDVAAYFGRDVDPAGVPGLPDRVDLLVLDGAPLELAGRVAMEGRLLFDDDPESRVAWEATTRKIWLDERPRVERARRDFAEAAVRRSGRSRPPWGLPARARKTREAPDTGS